MSKNIIIIAVVALLGVSIFFLKDYFKKIEQPSYKLLSQEGDFELREYPFMHVADVRVAGSQIESLRQGFRILAKYISGENSKAEKIDMTAPVLLTRESYKWKTSFIMPRNIKFHNLPHPLDKKVKLGSFHKTKVIVLKFNGNVDEENLSEHYLEMKKYLKNHDVVTVGEPIYAFYNPPWIPSFMKRNEILLEVIS